MSLTRLMLHIAHECLFAAEASGEFLGIGEVTPAVTADIKDQSIAESKVLDNFVEVAFSNTVGKTTVVYIADVVIEYAICYACCDAIVGS